MAPCYSCSWWTPSVCLGLEHRPLPHRRPHHCLHSGSARCLRAGRAWRLLGMGNRRREVVYALGSGRASWRRRWSGQLEGFPSRDRGMKGMCGWRAGRLPTTLPPIETRPSTGPGPKVARASALMVRFSDPRSQHNDENRGQEAKPACRCRFWCFF